MVEGNCSSICHKINEITSGLYKSYMIAIGSVLFGANKIHFSKTGNIVETVVYVKYCLPKKPQHQVPNPRDLESQFSTPLHLKDDSHPTRTPTVEKIIAQNPYEQARSLLFYWVQVSSFTPKSQGLKELPQRRFGV